MKNFLLSMIPDKSDVFLFGGLGSLFYGAYQINIPSSFIITGVLLMCIGYIQVMPTKEKG